MADPLRHRQTKGAATDMVDLTPPRHIPTLPWNKTHKIGGDIVVAKLNADGTVKSIEPFITGFIVDNNYIGRPVDMEWLKDGSMLLSDDYNGAVYRITYGPQRVSMKR